LENWRDDRFVELEFCITDTGIGISREKLGHIFESFSQADTSTTRNYGGTGLGLTISQRLVELMGGRVWVESVDTVGSKFFFTVRLKISDDIPEPALPTVFDVHGLKVLVVDDNYTNRMILREELMSWGAEVFEAEDGMSGLLKLREAVQADAPFQLLLLDHQMPGMDGIAVVEEINVTPELKGIVVMILTSSGIGGISAQQAQELGVAAYLAKPVRRNELQNEIAQALCGKSVKELSLSDVSSPKISDDNPMSILLAEDNVDNQNLILAYLKKTSHTVHVAENGAVAVEKFIAGNYDLVLMDMQMPIMDGYAATRAIREWEVENELPETTIVALTAFAMAGDAAKSAEAGCDGHLIKPIKKKELVNFLHDVQEANQI